MKIILTYQNQKFPEEYRPTLNNLIAKGVEIQYCFVTKFFDIGSLPITRFVSENQTIVEHGFREGLELIRDIDSIPVS